MGRRPEQTCSLCTRGVSLKESRDDGNGGRRCKPDCEARKAADVKAPTPAPVEAPAEKKPRVNRRGKPTVESEAARTCRVRGCGCSVGKSCDMGAGRTCCWTSADTPAEGDTCSLCAELIDAAEEAIEKAGGKVPDGLAAALYENCDAPALGDDGGGYNARLGACIEIAVARRTPSKKDRPRDTRKPAAEAPAQVTLPGSEVARTLTLPMGREPLAAVPADRGACEACGTKLTPENSSRLPSGRVVHVGCERALLATALASPCDPDAGGCGAVGGEPCFHSTPEPASYVHDARLAALPAEEREAARRRAAEDRIRAALDEHARIPGDPPVPSRDGLVRALVVPGDFDVFTLRDGLAAMIERGEVRELESDRVPGAKYLRRAEGAPPVVMGRVGARVSEPIVSPEGERFDDLFAEHEAARIDRGEADGLAQVVGAKAREQAADVVGQALTVASGAQAVASLSVAALADRNGRIEETEKTEIGNEHGEGVPAAAPIVDESEPFALCPKCFACIPKAGDATDDGIAALLSERPDERLAAQLGAAASHVEDLATFVRHAAEALQALRAEARELSELRAELATAKDLARLASLEAADAKDESRSLRGALANIVEALGGTVPEKDDELISEAVGRARRPRSEPLRGALRDIVGELGGELPERPTDEQLCVGALERAIAAAKAVRDLASQIDTIAAERNAAGSERDIARGDARNMAGRVMALRAFVAPLAGLPAPHEATDHELIAAAEQHVLPLRAAVEGAIGELTGAAATSAKPLAEQLMEAVATFGPRAGDFSTELETAAALAVYRLTGAPAPMGRGRVAIAEALTAAVEATAAKLAVRRMRVPGATPETDSQPKPRVVF